MNFDLHALWLNRSINKGRQSLERSSLSSGGPSSSGSSGYAVAVAAEVNRKDALGRTVLHLIVSEASSTPAETNTMIEWLELVLRVTGVNVNSIDTESGWTPLHRALWCGNLLTARMLLARDDINSQLKDREGELLP